MHPPNTITTRQFEDSTPEKWSEKLPTTVEGEASASDDHHMDHSIWKDHIVTDKTTIERQAD